MLAKLSSLVPHSMCYQAHIVPRFVAEAPMLVLGAEAHEGWMQRGIAGLTSTPTCAGTPVLPEQDLPPCDVLVNMLRIPA